MKVVRVFKQKVGSGQNDYKQNMKQILTRSIIRIIITNIVGVILKATIFPIASFLWFNAGILTVEAITVYLEYRKLKI